MMPFGRFLYSLVSLLVFLSFCGQGIVIDVYRNGQHVRKYEDDSAENEGRAASLPNQPLRGQMYYAVPYRNACEPIDKANETVFNWVALIDNYYDCPDEAWNLSNLDTIGADSSVLNLSLYDLVWNLFEAGYGMMLTYSVFNNVNLHSTPSLPRAVVTSYSFIDYLRNNTIIGISPNASEFYIKVQTSEWLLYEELLMIFGGILLAAVSLSILIFCGSVCCRTAVNRWHTRGLSRWTVRQLPKRKYRKGKEVCESCSICLEDFKAGENLRVLPCDHSSPDDLEDIKEQSMEMFDTYSREKFFHPSCVDEWLQKWNRTCPLCKSTIQRRRGRAGNGDVPLTAPSSTTDHEHAHLLSNEEISSDNSEGRGRGEVRRDSDNYGAIGQLDNPLSGTVSDIYLGGGEEGMQEESVSLEQSVNVTLEIEEPHSSDVGERSDLVWNEDSNSVTGTAPLEEHA